jgi:signal transduction histidine kinase
MPWMEAVSDPRALRRCIDDLVALSTLPARWKNHHPEQIAGSISSTLLPMLGADIVYVRLATDDAEFPFEATDIRPGVSPDGADDLRHALLEWVPQRHHEPPPNPVVAGELRLVFAPVGAADHVLLVAGWKPPALAAEVHGLLLEIAAGQATLLLDQWKRKTDGRPFLSLVERSSDFIGVASLAGSPQYINPAGLRLIGLASLQEAASLHILDLLATEERDRAREEVLPIVIRSGRWAGELWFRHQRTGASLPFLVDWFRIDEPQTGRPLNIATVSRDLRAQKRAEVDLRTLNETLELRVAERTAALEQANRQLVVEIAERERADARFQELQLELFHASRLSAAGQMATTLAHELNQPLTASVNSINAARRLLAGPGKTKADKIIEIMDEAADQALRGGRIIRRLREFVSRGEAEKRSEKLPLLIEEAGALALAGAGRPSRNLHFNFDPSVANVMVSRIQIQQVLINLIRNAFEAHAGRRRPAVTVSTQSLNAATVEVAVADNGPGLPREVRSKLFEPFVTTKRDGMGLGLSIARSIVEAHGGKLRADDNPGGGTIFRFTLPSAPLVGDDNGG